MNQLVPDKMRMSLPAVAEEQAIVTRQFSALETAQLRVEACSESKPMEHSLKLLQSMIEHDVGKSVKNEWTA